MILALAGVSACEDKGIGLPCELESQAGGDGGVSSPETTQVIPQAVECPESICIQMARRPPTKGGDPQPQAPTTVTKRIEYRARIIAVSNRVLGR